MEPLKIGKIIEEFRNSEKFVSSEKRCLVFSKFNEIVRDTFGKYTKPFKYKNNILYLKVSSSSHINELFFYKEEILKRLNLELNGIFVKDIKFLIGEEYGIWSK